MTGAGFLLLLVPPALWGLVRAFDLRRSARLEALVGPRVDRLVPGRSPGRRAVRRITCALALLLGIVAWLLPEARARTAETEWRGMDLVVCLDVSRSMLARDVVPDRLGRARREVLGLAGGSQGDRIGLVVFAGEAALRVPLTQDALSFAGLTARVDPSDVARGGSDLGAALDAAAAALPGTSDRAAAILLLTDGEDLGGRGLAAAEALAEQGIVVHAVGFGSSRGSKIPLEEEGGSRFLVDRAGRDVVSALDSPGLKRIAAATGGTFVDARDEDEVLTALYEDHVLPTARASIAAGESDERGFPFQLPLAAAFLLGVLSLGIGERRRDR